MFFGNRQLSSFLFSSFCCQTSLINGHFCSIIEDKKWWIPHISEFAAQIVVGETAVCSLHFPRWAYNLETKRQGKRLRLVKNAHPVSNNTQTHATCQDITGYPQTIKTYLLVDR